MKVTPILGTETDLTKNAPKSNTPRRLSKTFILKDFDNLVHQLELMNEGTLNSNDSNDTLPVSEE